MRARFDPLDLVRKPLASVFRQLFAAILREFAQLGLLFERQEILGRHQQAKMDVLHLALDIKDFVDLGIEGRFIHVLRFRERRKRSRLALQLHPQCFRTRLRLLQPRAKSFLLLRRQREAIPRQQNHFRREKRPGKRVGGRFGMVRREQRTQ